MTTFYFVLKALHIIFMVTWFAALFYLPRIYVYHSMALEKGETESNARFIVMEKKLYRLGHIGMGLMIVCGVLLLIFGGWTLYGRAMWLHIKLLLVLILVCYYVYCGRINKVFARGENKRSHVWYRWFNEAPSVFLIAIVFLAVLKPT